MKIIFMGTPRLSADILSDLAKNHDIVAVFTKKDAQRGRGKKLIPSPVKQVAESLDIPTYTPKTLRDSEVIESIKNLKPDVICVAAFGMLLPAEILEIPRFGCLNVHTSLLPRFRGAAPIERSILACDKTSGICIMRMEEGLDTGPVCECEEFSIEDLYLEEIENLCAKNGASLLQKALVSLENNSIIWTPQSGEGIIYANKISKGELNPLFEDSMPAIYAKVRASSESHAAKIMIGKRTVTLISVSPRFFDDSDADQTHHPGDVFLHNHELIMRCQDAYLALLKLKPDGKKIMEGYAFAQGLQGIKQGGITWNEIN